MISDTPEVTTIIGKIAHGKEEDPTMNHIMQVWTVRISISG